MKKIRDLMGSLEPPEREPLEVRAAVLDAIENLAQPLGGGRRGLVHNRITVRVLAADPARRLLLHAVLTAQPGLEAAVKSRLAGCVLPEHFVVEVTSEETGVAGTDFDVVAEIDKRNTASGASSVEAFATRPQARLVILLTGRELRIETDVFNIGRVEEVRGRDGRPLRRNHLAIGEGETTVSRKHAHIRYLPETDEFRLFDDGSARGTRIFSSGEPIDVPPGRGRGERLRSGDEIYFGSVAARFEIIS